MDLDLTWLLWGLPLAFAAGWLASRFDLHQWRLEGRRAPKAVFRGLNQLLNEQQDRAIDSFIEAVQNDPDTSELHFALGNLFRRRGDYDRAVRVHEHLLARGDLSQKDRDRAQHALALDFLKAGLLDRAEAALRQLEHSAFADEARQALLGIFERARDWPQAIAMAEQLDREHAGAYQTRLAHFYCELAAAATKRQAPDEALQLLHQARARAPEAPRPGVEIAALQQLQQQPDAALDTLIALAAEHPQTLPLVAHPMAQLAQQTGRAEAVRARLQQLQPAPPSIDVTEAIASLSTDAQAARATYLRHLESEASLVMAARWLASEPLGGTQQQALVLRALDQATQPLKRYRCAACGFEAKQYFWQCPGCQNWDSYPTRRVEEL
ncbi:MAG: lipopolysaccharide assembly protein LapB [Hydrogenophaga sp.]|nr:lipopolysaccharide assembly protein LapB [Hydrogenophaga sp.]